MEKPNELLTKTDLAAWLRIRRDRVDVLIRQNGLPAIFLPGKKREVVRFNRASVEKWLKSKEEFLPE